MFLYLMTNPLTNISGIYKLSTDRIVFDTGFNENTVKHILEKFMKAGKVATSGEYVIIPTWPKHQKVDENTKIRTGIESILSKLPKEVLSVAKEAKYQFPLDALLMGYTCPTNYSDSDSDSDSNLYTTRKASSEGKPSSSPNLFEDLPKAPKHNKAQSTPKEVDPLYRPIEQSFLSQGNFADYRKEGTCIKKIISSIRNLAPDDADNAARLILESFRALTSGNDKFWKDRPFLPSGLSPVIEQVWTIAKKGSSVPSMSWYDELMRQKRA